MFSQQLNIYIYKTIKNQWFEKRETLNDVNQKESNNLNQATLANFTMYNVFANVFKSIWFFKYFWNVFQIQIQILFIWNKQIQIQILWKQYLNTFKYNVFCIWPHVCNDDNTVIIICLFPRIQSLVWCEIVSPRWPLYRAYTGAIKRDAGMRQL